MSWMAAKLKNRVQILQGVSTPNANGGWDYTYKRLVRLWAGVEVLNKNAILTGSMPIRGVNIDDLVESHEIRFRYDSVISKYDHAFGDAFDGNFDENTSNGLGKSFGLAFSDAFNSITDLNPIKADYFILLERGSTGRGKLLKIKRVVPDDVNYEWVFIRCIDQYEVGAGRGI